MNQEGVNITFIAKTLSWKEKTTLNDNNVTKNAFQDETFVELKENQQSMLDQEVKEGERDSHQDAFKANRVTPETLAFKMRNRRK